MHRVKRPSPKTNSSGFSQVHYHTKHDIPGEEPKVRKLKPLKSGTNFQLNAIGGPLEEDFKDTTLE